MRNDPSDNFTWPKTSFWDVPDKQSYFWNSESVHKWQFQVSRESVNLIEADFQVEWEQEMLLKLRDLIPGDPQRDKVDFKMVKYEPVFCSVR